MDEIKTFNTNEMDDEVNYYNKSFYVNKFSNQPSPVSFKPSQNVYRPPASTSSVTFDNSWIKNHMDLNRTAPQKKKLTHFLGALLSYDVSSGGLPFTPTTDVKSSPEIESLTDKPVLLRTPDHNPVELQSDFDTENGEVRVTVTEEIESNPKIAKKHKETESSKTVSRLEKYITETWERYRKRYEHLGEKNPFANDPPSPEFLLKQQSFPGEEDHSSSNEDGKGYESVHKHEKVIVSGLDDNQEHILPSHNENHSFDISPNEKIVTTSLSDENSALNGHTLEPDEAEELDSQSESNSESDQIINNNETFVPIDDETPLVDIVDESKIQEDKQSAASGADDREVEIPNEYDEVNHYKSKQNSLKVAVPDVRGLSTTNEGNHLKKRSVHSITDPKVNHLEINQPDSLTRVFRKPIRKPQKQYAANAGTHQQLKPLINPFLISPLGAGAMMPSHNPLYPFQSPGIPFNYWMAKPPFNQFNMFPYGFPWQSLPPFTSPYFHPFFQQNIAPSPQVGSSLVGQHSFTSASPVGPPMYSAQGRMNVPYYEAIAGSGYEPADFISTGEIPADETDFKVNYNKASRTHGSYQSQFYKPEPISPYPGQHSQQNQQPYQKHNINKVPNQPFRHDNKWMMENELNQSTNSRNHRGQSTHMFDPPDFRQHSFGNQHNSRSNPSVLPSSELNMQVSPLPSAPSSYQWHRDQSNLEQNWPKVMVSHPPFTPPSFSLPPTNHPYPHQRHNDQNVQYGRPIQEYGRTRVRSNTNIPTQPLGEQLPVQRMPYHSWYQDTPQYGHGNFQSHNYNANGLPAQL